VIDHITGQRAILLDCLQMFGEQQPSTDAAPQCGMPTRTTGIGVSTGRNLNRTGGFFLHHFSSSDGTGFQIRISLAMNRQQTQFFLA
jgi:hypothetical protein